mgnify:FL=1
MNRNNTTILLIVFLAISFLGWKKYEQYLRKKFSVESIIVDPVKTTQIEKKRSELEELAERERQKIKVMVEHDNRPETNTYPMILDASRSFDPDLGDQISFQWLQTSGPPVNLLPSPRSSKVSFLGTPGIYSFDLTVTDDYGAKTTIKKTVQIAKEPNLPPIVDIDIRQGSELK